METKLPSKYSLFSQNMVLHLTRDSLGYFKLEIPELADEVLNEITEIWLDERPADDAFGLVYKDINFVYDQETDQFVAMGPGYKPRIGKYAWVFRRSHDLNNLKLVQSADPVVDLQYFEYWVMAGEAYRTVGDNPEEYRDYGDVWVDGSTQTED